MIIGLKSTNFNFKTDNDNIIFSVIGYGHGVGMSQTGADALAKQGYNYEEIIKHFYNDVEILSIWNNNVNKDVGEGFQPCPKIDFNVFLQDMGVTPPLHI